jgi:iron complex outermembrane receptor protein
MTKIVATITMLLCLISMQAQKINGTVTDATKNPMTGVIIYEKGTTNGTTSDLEGKYAINVTSKDAILIFSFVGFSKQELSVTNGTQIDVTLQEGISLGEVQVVGSRSYARTATDSPVAIDVIDVAQLATSTGKVEINQILQYAAPSFNATKQSGSDGADHIDPASLRGLGPDQTLVLINGKRRHQSSLVNVFGTRGRGNTGTDLNAIPVSAIKRIEVLRDGASAQYGSDAIAGVINIVLKDDSEGLTVGFTHGAHSTAIGGDYAKEIFDTQGGWEPELYNIEGENRLDGESKAFDGNTYKVDLNYGLSLGEKGGYVNFTTEYLTRARTLRPSFEWRKGYGSAAVDQFQFMANAAVPLSERTELYLFGGRGNRETDAFAFTRGAPGIDGDDRAVPSLYPNGFTPHITSGIIDNSVTGGVRTSMENGWHADFSHSYGSNKFQYLITGTNNASLGSASPTDFDAGGHSLSMNVTGMDFSKYMSDIAAGLNVAFGAEYRAENFRIFSGEEGSYAAYDTNGVAISLPVIQIPYTNEFDQQPGGGSQGFPGYSPANVVDSGRSNMGFYADVELNATKKLLFSGALRFENYSDFGKTLNYKLATRYKITKGLSFRASASSGFRAPSLAQVHYNLIFNNIVAGTSLSTLLASNTSTVAKAFGIEPLKEETAQNFAGGFTFKKSGFTATIDGYMISVKDRIILTDIFDATALNVGAEAAQFFANGVDTKTTGIDIVLSYKHYLSNGTSSITAGVAGNFNKTEIEKINSGDLNEFTFFGPFSQAYLQAAAPDHKFGFNFMYSSSRFHAMANYTFFSQVILQDFQWVDTPATNQEEADALFEVASDVYEAAGSLDLSVGYDITNGLNFTLGGSNLLNTYPTQQYDGWTDQGGFNDSVQMGSDGMYLFGKITFKL